jgi:hypothetical protein
VAFHALLGGKEPLAVRGVTGAVEVSQRVEEPNEVLRLLGVELGPGDAHLRHALGHSREVVPHRRREVVERVRLRDAREIGTGLPPGPIEGVAFRAALGVEDAGPRHRILPASRHLRRDPTGGACNERDDDDQDAEQASHGSHH